MTTRTKTERSEAIERLRECVNPGDTIYTITRHRSSSGMLHVLQVIVIKDEEPRCLGYNIAEALGYAYDKKHEGVRMAGCGYDKGHQIAYDIGYLLFGDARALTHRAL